MRGPRIAIVGAGLSGLCLAQGLRKAGVDVAVYERDASPSSRAQGYRISIDSRGTEALRACLPPRLYQLYEATLGQPSLGVAVFATDGETLELQHAMHFSQSPRPGLPASGRAVDRLILRETLMAGIADAVHFGKTFTDYEAHADGVEARFAGAPSDQPMAEQIGNPLGISDVGLPTRHKRRTTLHSCVRAASATCASP